MKTKEHTEDLHLKLEGTAREQELHVRRILHSLVARHFPKECGSCRTVYDSESDYTHRTTRCGNAKYIPRHGIIQFCRTCECGTTFMIPVEHEEFNASELNLFAGHIDSLADMAKSETMKRLKYGHHIRGNGFWKYMRDLPKFVSAPMAKPDYDLVMALNDEDWKEIGLCIFRDRYNQWVRKK